MAVGDGWVYNVPNAVEKVQAAEKVGGGSRSGRIN